MSAGSSLNLRKETAALAAGMAVFTEKIKH
jgi:hypothetical protein